jgi:hypothetical protein
VRHGADIADASASCHAEVLSKEDEALLAAFARGLPEALAAARPCHPGFRRKTRGEARKCQARTALDRSPLDAHGNAAAHRLMAREVARVVEQ